MKFSGHDESPVVELSVVIPTKEVTHGPVWDNFARDLVVWAAPRIPAANKGEALRRCLAEVDAATCSRAFADVDPTPLTCVPSY